VTKDHEKGVLEEIASTSQPVRLATNDRGNQLAASNGEMLMLFELARALGGENGIATSGEIVAEHLRQFLPATICVFFRYDPKHDELVAAYASGDGAFVLEGARIGLGERLSGWVAANRRTILNSDPALDLSEELRASLPKPLCSSISSPLLAADELVGVLTLYSTEAGVFNDEHQRIIEVVGQQVGPLFKKAMLPADDELCAPYASPKGAEHWLSTGDYRSFGVRNPFTLLFIRVVDLAELSRIGGRIVAEEIMRHVARQTTGALRLADVLCRCDPDGFVAFLDDADSEMGDAVARRIHDNFKNNPFPVPGHSTAPLRVSVRCVSAPQDGKSLHDLIDRLTLSSERPTIGSGTAIH
jgi:diguanylate cyclase (GGDEF)-like protein